MNSQKPDRTDTVEGYAYVVRKRKKEFLLPASFATGRNQSKKNLWDFNARRRNLGREILPPVRQVRVAVIVLEAVIEDEQRA